MNHQAIYNTYATVKSITDNEDGSVTVVLKVPQVRKPTTPDNAAESEVAPEDIVDTVPEEGPCERGKIKRTLERVRG
jgi:hypothetical protein